MPPAAATTRAAMPLPPPAISAGVAAASGGYSIASVIRALSVCTTIDQIKQIHAHIWRTKLDHRSYSLLFDLVLSYSSLSLSYAISVFSSMHSPPPSHLFNRLLRQLSRSGEPSSALLFYRRIRDAGGLLDEYSFPPLLKAAAKVSTLVEGMEIHGVAVKLGSVSDPFVETCLMGMYTSCDRVADARKVFDRMAHRDVVSWNAMIDGYCRRGILDEAFKLFEEMKNSNVMPDEIILCNIVSACGRVKNLNYSKAVHRFIIENKVKMDAYLLSALVTMYAGTGCMDMAQQLFAKMPERNLIVSTAMVSGFSRAGRIDDARAIFCQMEEKDLVCWSAMISGYAENDRPEEALRIFEEMLALGINPDQITMLSVISACANLGTMDKANSVHSCIDHYELGSELPINNALIDMYAKCGSLERARDVFEKMPRRNVTSWTSMINAFAMHGESTDALSLFARLKEEKIEPNGVTFLAVLYACNHAGFVEEGKMIFASMVDEYDIAPKHEHYGCMVDLLGRANRLREALDLIESMPMASNVIIWGSLMSACRIHDEFELGELAAKRVLDLEPRHGGALVILSNIYAREQRWDDARNIRQLMEEKGVVKDKGISQIDPNGKTREKHEQSDKIYSKLDSMRVYKWK
ncbi:PREDICTED: pentatricopeptide repeat-containing protein At4g14820 [Tarenaya hassleriana]|uniref:pentatricopeptide repeat-containing protein At4g14820 n=1 Tax=Tarenaya hassleriana TaxID=28532 RepID=UPI00053C5BDF|nr:PREDICTED: pentatricopeptide repeat-containing protein At4g14820 [Tarenaya hassleriana]